MLKNDAYMQLALDLAQKAFAIGEVPVGAVLVCGEQIVAKAYNQREQLKSPFGHAEIQVIQEFATQKGDWRLSDCELYVTLEPCLMCLGAIYQARVKRLIFGAFDEKRVSNSAMKQERYFPSLVTFDKNQDSPLIVSSNNHNLEVISGVMAKECSQILKDFFKKRRS